MDTKDTPDHIRHEWARRKPHWPAGQSPPEIRLTPEWWALDGEEFDGAWMLEECGTDLHGDATRLCVARMLVVRTVGRAVRFDMRSEDLTEDVSLTNAYLEQLRLSPIDLWSAKRILAALLPFDAERLVDELLRMSACASGAGLDASARSLAHSAYDAAARHANHAAARDAALALSRLAKLQECPRTSRRWRGIAHAHGKRASRAAKTPAIDE